MRSQKDIRGIMLIAGVVVIMGGLLAVRAIAGGGPKPDNRNCIGQPTASTVVVFDRSDDVSIQTLNEMRARALSLIRDSTAHNELVSIFSISQLSKHSLVPLVSLCRPARTGNRLWQNPALIERRFAANFDVPIQRGLDSVHGPAPESPLAQAFVDLSLTGYLQSSENRLHVFSDMFENTAKFSLYRCSEEGLIDRFRNSRQGAVERPTFRNTSVALHLIPRLGVAESTVRCRDKLWMWFFGDNSGSRAGLDFHHLPGGEPPPPRR